jgi:hypothetical protein
VYSHNTWGKKQIITGWEDWASELAKCGSERVTGVQFTILCDSYYYSFTVERRYTCFTEII